MQVDILMDESGDESKLSESKRQVLNKRKQRHYKNSLNLFENRDDSSEMTTDLKAKDSHVSSLDSLIRQIKATVT